ncbi:MAG: U32 family peptidase [Planctomycetes bacterium]|nr:U32 family peptidase [Planctomycetota bacterium]
MAPGGEFLPPGPCLAVLCRTMEQLDAALSGGASWVECDFEDLRRYKEAVERTRTRGIPIALAPPRIFKPGEAGFLSVLLKAAPDALLVRSTAHLAVFAREAPGTPRIGDYSLNVANDLSAAWALDQGLARFVPSYDLNFEQLSGVLSRIDPSRAEVVVHQHMPMFHMEHCVFAAALSKGKDWTDCGRPCDRHRVSLRDWAGKEHPLVADAGCRNTVYNAVPQSASQYVRRMLEAGVRWFRVELLGEDAAGARRLVNAYREVLDGARDGETLWRELRASNVMGVTRGPLGREG